MDRFLERRVADLPELLAATYPVTAEQLVDEFGDREISLPNGSETVGSVLDRVSPDTYETPAEVQQAILNGLGNEAIGRRFYSDRDPPVQGVDDTPSHSF